ncbi:MAG: hypothetical protein P3W94_002240 [Paracoccus sp. (in: a-proteobacteria)]|nr:hypothetical protein [Paracoccus sp. (in: a-proteobacteria)]
MPVFKTATIAAVLLTGAACGNTTTERAATGGLGGAVVAGPAGAIVGGTVGAVAGN